VGRTDTRERILAAAVRTLATEGYAKTTARAIARVGGFAPGVIYYHFTDLDDLFVATAEFTSEARLRRYRAETDGVSAATDLLRRLRTLYAEDGADGHIAAVQELVGAAVTAPRLAAQVRVETARWLAFAEEVINRLVGGTPLASLVPVRETATAVVGAYLGIEMLTHLDPDLADPNALFDAAGRAAELFDGFRRE